MRRILTIGLAAVLSLAAACGDESDSSSTQGVRPSSSSAQGSSGAASPQTVSAKTTDILSSAAFRASEESSYKFEFDMAITGVPDLPGALTMTGRGSIDGATGRSHVSIDMRDLVQLLAASGDASAEELAAVVGDGVIEVVQDGTTVYMRFPFFSELLGTSTPWVSMVAPDGSQASLEDLGLGSLGGFGAFGDPTQGPGSLLEGLQVLDENVRKVGTESVRGVDTTRYSGTLDLFKLLALAAPEAQAELGMPAGVSGFEMPFDVWIDGDGLPRRMRMTMDFSSMGFVPAGSEAPAMSFTYEMFDYGEPVTIRLPDASEVTPIEDDLLYGLN